MMLSASPSMVARSSLEEMLESLRRRDECERPKDLPPALPARPTSRARLPSARKSLPTDFKVGEENGVKASMESAEKRSSLNGKEDGKRKEKEWGAKRNNSFGSKKLRKEQTVVDLPYDGGVMLDEEKVNEVLEVNEMKSAKSGEVEWEDNLGYFIKKKLRVWCRLEDGKWESGMIQSTSGDEAFVLLSNGNVVKVSTGELLPANPDILEGVDDLIQLSYLNEPSVLNNIQYRYSRDMIYSKAGPVLIAVNPFKAVPIYGNKFITAYRQKVMDSPHVYAIADTAYNEMMGDGVNQSIIIRLVWTISFFLLGHPPWFTFLMLFGESGAGKTETAKFAMQYLAALGGGSEGIEYEILQTNHILEAFGNAKTSRNDNSSRFSRVVQLAAGERSYHIFYQLCAGAPSFLKERLNLKVANDYNYLNQSECLTIDGVDDAQNFHNLMEALDIVLIRKEDREQTFAMLAAVLWLGNISFQVIDNENHVEVIADEAVTTAAMLMGCSSDELMLALSTHKIQAGKDSIAKKLTLQQAIDSRDALAKFIYGSLFDWIVEQINKSLEVGKQCTGRSINILDIYGFESFKKNSFEQFCINYANERLQQHFNRHLFKLEQEEYELDGVDWTRVEFEDNEECLNLIEKKPLGVLSLLDEESNFPKATDLTFANKLKQHLGSNSCFKGERGRAFSIRHYAGEVPYDTNGFLEKNRDPLQIDIIQLLSSCTCQVLQLFASKMLKPSPKPAASSQPGALDTQKQSVGTKFKGQLFKLMHQLENTRPHFIRCIKPNSKQLPGIYEEDLVLQQFRCCGVLEIVRISRSGYPTRMRHQEFAGRYGVLLSEKQLSQDPLSISVAVLQQFNVLPEMYQVGYTKLYLRSGQLAALEDRRKQVLQAIIRLQKCFRGYQARSRFRELCNGVITLQSFARGENTRRRHASLGKSCSAVVPEIRDEQLREIICLQSAIRGWLVRKQLKMHKLKQSNPVNAKVKRRSGRKSSDMKDVPQEQVQALPTALAELQRRVLKAEATLGQKEEENAALREQLQQYDAKWLEYEAKMKSMEEMWQKQMASLQMSLAAARKSLASDNTPGEPGRLDASTSPHLYDSEDTMSMGSRTPGGSTPMKFLNIVPDAGSGRESNGSLTAVNHLTKEFEQRRQNFDDDAKALIEIKTTQPASTVHPDVELRKLKMRFETWKKDYKTRLREAKVRLNKLGQSEVEKTRRKWWEKISSRVQ
ncbi:Myosin-2 [Citrus sinensis]|nr:Myosin-2 [Citrus sinensis]